MQGLQSSKRKRDLLEEDLINNSIKSLSQLSIVQEATKKMKNTTEEGTSSDNQSNPFDEIEFNLHKKKKKEQNFILSRL